MSCLLLPESRLPLSGELLQESKSDPPNPPLQSYGVRTRDLFGSKRSQT